MNIVVAYVCVTHGEHMEDFASRFVASYGQFLPGRFHRFIVACNGGELSHARKALFWPLNADFFVRDNDGGWDIGAYRALAHGPAADADIIVCLGESVYFHREGWLERLVECWKHHGPGIYGFFSSNVVRPHLNTTAFATSPKLLRDYPHQVFDRATRYNFEHGENSFWRWCQKFGHPAKLVTWDGFWDPRQWRTPHNCLWRGDQSNCLMFCNHSEGFERLTPVEKAMWQRYVDAPYR